MTYDLKTEFDRDGFVVVRNFLTGDDFKELTRNLDRYVRDIVPTLPDSDVFYQDRSRPETLKQMQHMGCDPFFEQYRQQPQWKRLAETLLGEPAKSSGDPEWFNKPPETGHRTPPHQDNFYFCLNPPQAATLWLALDKVDTENGCLRYVAGSHVNGVRPHQTTDVIGFSQGLTDFRAEDKEREQMILIEPGDLAAHHCNVIHRADPNLSATHHRRAFAMVYQGASCQRDEAAHQHYLAAAKRQQQAKGMNV